MTINDFLGKLQGVKQQGHNKWIAHCPCSQNHKHKDKKPSFSVAFDTTTEKILVYCHAGCTYEEICGAMGCGKGDLMPQPKPQEQLWNYLDYYSKRTGLVLESVYSYDYGKFNDRLTKVRFRESDGNKTFRWIHGDSSKKNGYGMGRSDCPHRLYFSGNVNADTVYIVEGEKDADTLHELTGYTAVSAENGASKSTGSKWREEYTAQLEGKTVYILWDNDSIGKQFAELEAQALEGHATHIFMLDLAEAWKDCPEKGDISDMVETIGEDQSKSILQTLIQNATERPKTAVKPADDTNTNEGNETPQEAPQTPKTALQVFDEFMKKIQTEAYKPLNTGMPAFDDLLGGGIQRQALVILTAAPGTGKTTFAQQVFEAMAEKGADVLFLNLEMSREQLLSRSLSRIAHEKGYRGISSADILKGYSWKNDEKRRGFIMEVADIYRRSIAERMNYNPPGMGTTLESIVKVLNDAGEKAQQAKKPAPVVILDYLHLVTTDKREEQSEIVKKTVAALKDYAIKFNTFVFAISATNRTSSTRGVISLESGRDTSAIEYTADIALSLNYAALHDKTKIPMPRKDDEGNEIPGSTEYQIADANNPDHMEYLQKQQPRQMLVQVLKNRMNEPGGRLYLSFDAAQSRFITNERNNQKSTTDTEGWENCTELTPFEDD